MEWSAPAPDEPTSLTLDQLGDALGRASTVLRANAGATDLHAPVPTCPGWTVADLVAHTGMAHRWAASHLRGAPLDFEAGETVQQRALSAEPDLLGWFDAGATDLLQAIVDAPDDLTAFVFLRNAPPARLFWARRQCHETIIHAVDALAARLGRTPRADETWLDSPVALDGIDELLRGFVPRRRQGINPSTETVVLVRPDETTVAWRLAMGPDHPVEVTLHTDARSAAYGLVDREVTGHPVELYLRLWNRGEHLDHWWRELVRITWR